MNLAKFLVQAFLSPSIFFIYMILLGGGSLGSNQKYVLGMQSLTRVSTNVYAINLSLFIPFSLITYAAWFYLNFFVIKYFRKQLSFELYKLKRLTWWCLVPCSIGGLNLLVWIWGMEGNIFGFLFALPMLLANVIQFAQMARQNWQLLRAV